MDVIASALLFIVSFLFYGSGFPNAVSESVCANSTEAILGLADDFQQLAARNESFHGGDEPELTVLQN
jgi:hypothetical protein